MVSRRSHQTDDRQLDLELFALPGAAAPAEGGLDFDKPVRGMLNRAIKECPADRHDIAAAMSRLTGDEISKMTIDAWTGATRTGWNFPTKYLPAFIEATGAHWILDLIAQQVGCRVLAGHDVHYANIARLDARIADLKRARADLGKRTKTR